MGALTPVVLSIGTTHPLGIAGITLDQRVAERLGIRLVTIIAGVSAQDAQQVRAVAAVDDATIEAQFDCVAGVPIGAIRIGALVGARAVAVVARRLADTRVPIVCDPVIAASTGERLADDAAVAALGRTLFACCTLVTPNVPEAEVLAGAPIAGVDGMEHAAAAIRARSGAQACLVKGGHLAGDAVDVLVDSAGVVHYRQARLARSMRGTGDLLALAIAAALAGGASLRSAVESGRHAVRDALERSRDFAGASSVA